VAESTLSVDINTIRREVGNFLAWGRTVSDYTTAQLQDFDDICNHGLRMFYFPPTGPDTPYYEWSFLRKVGTITLATGTYTHDLPDDFGGTILDRTLVFAEGQGKRALQKTTEDSIRKHRSIDQQTGVPRLFAVRVKTHAPTTGQRWEILLYPTPAAAENDLVLTYRYTYVPDALTNTNKYPSGGAQYSETILAAVMAAAEERSDDEFGGALFQKFMTMLGQAIRADEQVKNNQSPGS